MRDVSLLSFLIAKKKYIYMFAAIIYYIFVHIYYISISTSRGYF